MEIYDKMNAISMTAINNTTSIVQPMDQGAISTFMFYY